MIDKLSISNRKTKITIDNITELSKLILNADFRFAKDNVYFIEFDEYYIQIKFRINGEILLVTYTSKLNKNKKFINRIPYENIEHLLHDFDRLSIKLVLNEEHYVNSFETDMVTYYQILNKIKGFSFSRTKNNVTNLYLNENLILSLIHNKKRVKFKEDINVTEDFKKEIYQFICDNIYNANLKLNHIRNDLFKNILDSHSQMEINELILKVQDFFNDYQKSSNLQTL